MCAGKIKSLKKELDDALYYFKEGITSIHKEWFEINNKPKYNIGQKVGGIIVTSRRVVCYLDNYKYNCYYLYYYVENGKTLSESEYVLEKKIKAKYKHDKSQPRKKASSAK